jgi:hypothetical protein
MRIAKILPSLCLLAALPFSSHAADRCEHSAPRELDLNLTGVKTVVFDIGPHELSVTGGKTGASAVRGKACASDTKRLAGLVIDQRREGDKLIVRAGQNGPALMGSWSGTKYAYLALEATLPDTIAVRVRVGSGEAIVDGVASLAADVGSGDLKANHIRGTVYADVGSGDIVVNDAGALQVVSVGSGDLNAQEIRGGTIVGNINSGDLRIDNTGGGVRIDSIGSGDAELSAVDGDVSVERIGSGSLTVMGVRGNLLVSGIGSGSVDHRNVAGQVRIPADD